MPTVRMPAARAARAITGAAPVPVPPPMPAVTKHICVPDSWSMISSIDSSAAAWPTSGSDPAPRPSVTIAPSCTSRVALDMVSAWASVLATMNSVPSRPSAIMLLTALPPPPPTPITVIFGRISEISGFLELFMTSVSYAGPCPNRQCQGIRSTGRLQGIACRLRLLAGRRWGNDGSRRVSRGNRFGCRGKCRAPLAL